MADPRAAAPKRQPVPAATEAIVNAAVDTLNTAQGLLLPIITLCDDIATESLSGQDAWHRAEACIALAEKACKVIEAGLGKLYAFPDGGAA